MPVKCWRSATAGGADDRPPAERAAEHAGHQERRVGQAGADAGQIASGEGRAERHHGQRIEHGDEEARAGVVEVRRDLVLAVVGDTGSPTVRRRWRMVDQPMITSTTPPMPRSHASRAATKCSTKLQAKGGDGAEHRIAQRRADARSCSPRRRRR